MPSPNLQTIRSVLALYAQAVERQGFLLSFRAATLATVTAEKQALQTQYGTLNDLYTATFGVIAQKTEEAFNLATQVATLTTQFSESEEARLYAVTQVDALAIELQTKQSELATATQTASELAALEVAEDLAQAQADLAAQAEIDALAAQINELLGQIPAAN